MRMRNIIYGVVATLFLNGFVNAFFSLRDEPKFKYLSKQISNLERNINTLERIDSIFTLKMPPEVEDSCKSWQAQVDSLRKEKDNLSRNDDENLSRALVYGYFTD